MPHLCLEHSANIIIDEKISGLFDKCHNALVDILPTNKQNCMSRVVTHQHYYVGDGSVDNGFIYLHCKVLKGRTKETLQKAAAALLMLLKDYFSDVLQQNANVRLSVEMDELSDVYLK